MLFGYLTLFTALIISLSAAVYSILGLTAIFAAAFWPVVIMGGSLEFGKIVTTLWLHKYWERAEIQYKIYLCSAVAILMLLTSMGVFGFLSKAHTDQNLVSGDVISKISVYDEKIKTSKDNIDTNRKALKQMDDAVDQTMSRSGDEKGAERAVQIRRSQNNERQRLLREIDAEQKKITALNEERAPIAAEVRKVEAEVGPIKYIAAMIYGDNPDANLLEKSVRWVIILIVIVFDPLALTLLLAATKALEWERETKRTLSARRPPEHDQEDDQLREENASAALNKKTQILDGLDSMWARAKQLVTRDTEAEHAPIEQETDHDYVDESEHNITPDEKIARRAWKEANPGETIKKHRLLYDTGHITNLPWNHPDYHPGLQEKLGLAADNVPTGSTGEVKGFGTSFPLTSEKGDMFLRVDQLPSVLYKFNGTNWIEVDKALSDQHAYNEAYIDHLIEKIGSGEYDTELLSDAERDSIEQRLNKLRKV